MKRAAAPLALAACVGLNVAPSALVAAGGSDDEIDLPVVSTGFLFGSGECPPDDPDDRGEPVRVFDDAPRLCIDPANTYTATFVTSEGDIVVGLHADERPGTVNNFVVLARYGYYDDTPIFRTEPRSGLFQGGGESNTSSPGYTIPDEGDGFEYPIGTLAMARTNAPDSAGGQWFFTTDPVAEYLGQYGTYVVFGRIGDNDSLAVAQTITAAGDANGVPTREISLETVLIDEQPAE